MAESTSTKYRDHSAGGVEIERDPSDATTKWLLAEGYISPVKASKAKGADERGVYTTSVGASDDPRLAENRENPVPVDKIEPHVANGDEPAGPDGETVVGKDRGLDVEPNGGPDVKVTPSKDAGTV